MPELTTEELEELQTGLVEAIASPEKQVANGAKQVTYRSLDELKAAHAFVGAQKAATANKRPRTLKIVNTDRDYH